MPQTITIEVVFETEHKPGTEAHLRMIAETELMRKGIKIEAGKIIM